MTPIRFQPVLAEAWALFRRDRDWLLRLAGPFLFLPTFALALLVPRLPEAPEGGTSEAHTLAWAELTSDWIARNGLWYVLAFAVGAFGSAAIYAAYLDRGAGDLRGALSRAGSLLPRYLLAALLVAVPTGAGLYLLVLPGLYVMGRTMLVGPALIGDRGLSATGAFARSLSLTRGSGLALMTLAAATFVAGWLAATPFSLADGQSPGRIGEAISAAGIAAVSTLVNLAQALIAIVAYRRVAR